RSPSLFAAATRPTQPAEPKTRERDFWALPGRRDLARVSGVALGHSMTEWTDSRRGRYLRQTLGMTPSEMLKALLLGLRVGHATRRAPATVARRGRKTGIGVTLSAAALELARASDVLPPATAMEKFMARPMDSSSSDENQRRHAVLTAAEADKLHDYFRRSADAFSKIGDRRRAIICAQARAAIRYELWMAGLARR